MREIAPFGLRMPTELKERIGEQAKTNGRSMNTEIVARLWASLEEEQSRSTLVMQPSTPAYVANELTEIERQLLTIFRRLPVEKQLALLSLFK